MDLSCRPSMLPSLGRDGSFSSLRWLVPQSAWVRGPGAGVAGCAAGGAAAIREGCPLERRCPAPPPWHSAAPKLTPPPVTRVGPAVTNSIISMPLKLHNSLKFKNSDNEKSDDETCIRQFYPFCLFATHGLWGTSRLGAVESPKRRASGE